MLANLFYVYVALGKVIEILFNLFVYAGFILENIFLVILCILAFHMLIHDD